MSVLDASAVLALTLEEPGQERVMAAILAGAEMTTASFAEVARRYVRSGATEADVRALRAGLPVTLVPVDEDLALRAALMGGAPRAAKLSLGELLCLALAQRAGVPVLTADRTWAEVAEAVGVTVETCAEQRSNDEDGGGLGGLVACSGRVRPAGTGLCPSRVLTAAERIGHRRVRCQGRRAGQERSERGKEIGLANERPLKTPGFQRGFGGWRHAFTKSQPIRNRAEASGSSATAARTAASPSGPRSSATTSRNQGPPRARSRDSRPSASATGPRRAQQAQPAGWPPGRARTNRANGTPGGAGASPSISSAVSGPA